MYRVIESSDRRAVDRVIDGRVRRDRSVERRAAAIVAAVRRRGDAALERFARKLDGLDAPIEVTPREIRDGAAKAPRDVRRAIASSARAIRLVAERQLPQPRHVVTAPGVTIELRPVPFARVGCYVPAGRFPLVSTLLMTAIPPAAAGVAEIIAVSPRPVPATLAAAREAGVTRLFRIGGAHAIAALAYGTGRVPRVDKIVGPGNAWVAAAKRLVAPDCEVDFEAGPTELVVVTRGSRGSRGPRGSRRSRGSLITDWIIADLRAQAEHDPDARTILVTPDRGLAREAVAAGAGTAIVTRDLDEAIALANRIAPEHVAVDDDRVAGHIRNAATIFVGPWSAPAVGDYVTGSNHVLPTGGAALTRGGLSAVDFLKVISVQRLTREGLKRVAPTAITLARTEGLREHARSIEVRL
jgi:histidinol dehydrogenase